MSPLGVLAWRERAQLHWLATPNWGSLRYLLVTTFTGSLAVSAAVAVAAMAAILPRMAPSIAPVAGAAELAWLCVPWLLLPPAALLVAGQFMSIYSYRYLVFCIPAMALLSGAGLASLGAFGARGRLAAAIGLAMLALAGLQQQLALRAPSGHADDIRGADSIVRAHVRPGDVVYDALWWRQLAAAYPYGMAQLADIALARTPAQAANFTGTDVTYPELRQRLDATSRVWVVAVGATHSPDVALRGLALRAVRVWHPHMLWLTLYQHFPHLAGRCDRTPAGAGPLGFVSVMPPASR